ARGRCRRLLVDRLLPRMSAEQTRRRELTELVADHVLGHVHRDELVPVVHGERVADELRQHGARPRPGLDHALLVLGGHGLDLLGQRLLNERPFLYATSHRIDTLLSRFAALAAADDEALRRLLLVARLDAFLLAPRAHHVAPAARAAAVRMVDRVHDFAADLRAATQPSRLAGFAPRDELVLFV